VAADWIDPVTGRRIKELLSELLQQQARASTGPS
jgi:hypothetical protein